MTSRASACSDAIHKVLFPRTDAIHRMANSRRQIEEIIREHFPEGTSVRQLHCVMRVPVLAYSSGWPEVWRHITDWICGVLPDELHVGLYSDSQSISAQGLHLFRPGRIPNAAEPNIMPERYSIFGKHPTSDPTHVAD